MYLVCMLAQSSCSNFLDLSTRCHFVKELGFSQSIEASFISLSMSFTLKFISKKSWRILSLWRFFFAMSFYISMLTNIKNFNRFDAFMEGSAFPDNASRKLVSLSKIQNAVFSRRFSKKNADYSSAFFFLRPTN